MAFQLMEWINGLTKLNKQTMDNFQNNIKNAFDNTDTEIANINNTLNNLPETTQSDGILTGSVIGYKGEGVPEGYEEVENPNLEISSLQEVKTNKVWLDGKPVYQKVIKGIIPNSVSIIQIDLSADTLIKDDISYISSSGFKVNRGHTEEGIVQFDSTLNPNGNLYFSTLSNDAKGKTYTLIVEYTKITTTGGETI